ncbi:MAG: Gx transporter family protein [Nitrosomonadales bacterium]|jgi:heptaprenyl diphosphate synthase|nr:Gx transporter family protein [Nitrosomonadales bacterium]MBT4571078.1 Gx transporter family protein [Nitrosomonadales bacterium]MBT5149914.1 Gx transporter family protein [Nitrosomonadales bacterium]MBT5573087.1 Gx transporter family protein [Nitrosomonadales bacterium]MBT6602960.1 Gx transporter family protein [Nitrosomonadales bacterium]
MTQSIIKISKSDHMIAKLSAIAVALAIIDFFIPSPIPGVKPGIANIIILFTIYKYDFITGVWVSLLRVLVASMILGTFLGPTFFLSLMGAVMSLLSMYFLKDINKAFMSVIGLSVVSSSAHVLGQFLVVRLWIIPHDGILYLLPLFLLSSLIFGVVNGLIVENLLARKLNG